MALKVSLNDKNMQGIIMCVLKNWNTYHRILLINYEGQNKEHKQWEHGIFEYHPQWLIISDQHATLSKQHNNNNNYSP